VQVLGKSLRTEPVRARAELRARAAAAAAAARAGSLPIVALEATLRGQGAAGSALVAGDLTALGVPAGRMILARETCSTRQEIRDLARLVERHRWRRVLLITASYHVARARRQAEEALGPEGVAVHCPEAFLRAATPQERAWICAGTPEPDVLQRERRTERKLSALALVLSPLPFAVREVLEIRAGVLARGR